MGLFSNSPKPNPKIIVDGVEVEFHRVNEWWAFRYRGTSFSTFELSLTLPTMSELDAILNVLEALKPEMKERIKNGLSECGDSKLDNGETCSVDVKEFAAMRTFAVSRSGGASWGDLGVDFTIKDGTIIDEAWGD